MGINPNTNKIEELNEITKDAFEETLAKYRKYAINKGKEFYPDLVQPDGSLVPRYWAVFKEGEEVVIKDYTF